MKEKKLTVATVFVNLENVHLIKDPGMIPFALHKYYGYNSIIPFSSNQTYEYKEKYFNDIETPIIDDTGSDLHNKIARLKWIAKNAKRIDLLHLFFFERWTWIYIWIFKMFNPKGLVYVHCDTNGERLIGYKYPINPIKRFIIKKVLLSKKNLSSVLWGVQNKDNANKIKGEWPFINLCFVPNGIYWERNLPVDFEGKEDLIITVARNGSEPKRTDLLMEGFALVADKFPSWKLRLIGPIETGFDSYISEYFERFPQLKSRVQFPGAIYDRNVIEQEYARAKIFCLPSAWEGFSLSSVEALSKGCYIIGSDIASNIEVTNNGELGTLFKNGDLSDFASKLEKILNDENRRKSISYLSYNYAIENYTWEKIVKIIDDWIESKN